MDSWDKILGSVDPRFAAGLPFPVPQIQEFIACPDSGQIFPSFFPEFSRNSPREPANSHPKKNYLHDSWPPRDNCKKMPFPAEKCICLQKNALSCRKMHFPAEKCPFLQKNALSCRKMPFLGGTSQDIAGGPQGSRIKNASQLSQETEPGSSHGLEFSETWNSMTPAVPDPHSTPSWVVACCLYKRIL